MSSTIPKDWDIKKLGDVASLIMGQSPTSDTYNQNKNGTPFFQGKADFGIKHPNVRYWCTSPTKIAPISSILFSVRAPVGAINLNNIEACIGRGLASISGSSIDNIFLYQSLIHAKIKFEALGQGSTFEAINANELKEFLLICPPLPEQKKIAAILTSVDEVIEKTQQQIDKLQDLKKATMNELLTKGIGHTEFKDSPLGRIPKSWEVVSLKSLASQIKRGPSLSCNTNGHGVRYITSGNLVAGEVSLNGDYKFLDNFSDIEKCRLVANDLVLNCVNSSAKIGESAIFELDIKAIVGFNNYAITLDSAICVPRFIHHFCQTYLFRAQLKTVIKDAINQVSFSSKDLDLIRIPLPSLDEQYRIAESINVIWMKEKTNQSQIDKLKLLKKSLMQDLLTGKVRVAA